MKKCIIVRQNVRRIPFTALISGNAWNQKWGRRKTEDTQETVSEEIPEESQGDMAEMNLVLKEKLDFITGLLKKNWKLVLGAICALAVIVTASVVIKKQKIYH